MYYTVSMSLQTGALPGANRVRSVRMYDDAWALIGTRSRDRSPFIRDMTDAGLQGARCYRCFELVPVEYRDLTGKPLAEWVAEAQKTVTRQHRDGHHPITVGRGQGKPASPGAVLFMEPKPAARS